MLEIKLNDLEKGIMTIIKTKPFKEGSITTNRNGREQTAREGLTKLRLVGRGRTDVGMASDGLTDKTMPRGGLSTHTLADGSRSVHVLFHGDVVV